MTAHESVILCVIPVRDVVVVQHKAAIHCMVHFPALLAFRQLLQNWTLRCSCYAWITNLQHFVDEIAHFDLEGGER